MPWPWPLRAKPGILARRFGRCQALCRVPSSPRAATPRSFPIHGGFGSIAGEKPGLSSKLPVASRWFPRAVTATAGGQVPVASGEEEDGRRRKKRSFGEAGLGAEAMISPHVHQRRGRATATRCVSSHASQVLWVGGSKNQLDVCSISHTLSRCVTYSTRSDRCTYIPAFPPWEHRNNHGFGRANGIVAVIRVAPSQRATKSTMPR